MHEVERLAADAHAHARAGRWADAGRSYAAAGARALGLGAEPPARRAFEAAGEAFRRADVPREAARCLRVALTLPTDEPDATASQRARLAAVLGELGNGDGAIAQCRLAASEATTGRTRELVTDTTVGLLQGYGRKADWRERIGALGAIAGAFRSAQLARLDGALDEARAHLARVEAVFVGVPGGEPGAAAAACERAEIDALEGDAHPALAAYARAAELHRVAGRQALVWRCEAGRVRAAVDAGVALLPGVLDAGVAFAEQRGLRLLAVDLLIARGMARAARDRLAADADLTAAAADAATLGVRLREGRARWQRVLRLGASDDIEAIAGLLADHVPLVRRVRSRTGQRRG